MMVSVDHENSVIYSFKGKWLSPIVAGKIKIFFRKKLPRKRPNRIYFYVGAPTSAIIGWAQVSRISRVEAESALKMTKEGAIDPTELADYIKLCDSVGVIELGPPKIYSFPLSVSDAQRVFNFHPPQNFFRIDEKYASKLDDLGK